MKGAFEAIYLKACHLNPAAKGRLTVIADDGALSIPPGPPEPAVEPEIPCGPCETLAAVSTAAGGARAPDRGPRLCWNCDSPDHLKRNCPEPLRAGRLTSMTEVDVLEQGVHPSCNDPMRLERLHELVGVEPPARQVWPLIYSLWIDEARDVPTEAFALTK